MDPSALDSAISILENEISGLEKYVDGLEVWLWIASLAVVIGVVAEMYFILREYLQDRKAWRKGSISSPHRPNLLILVLELTSVFLVVAGVAGELVVGIMSGNANSHLREENTRLVSLVRQKAARADDRATSASDEAKNASRHEEELETRTEFEIDARLNLEKKFIWQGPRDIPIYAAQKLITDRLKTFAPQSFRISVCAADLNHEAWGALSEIGRTGIAIFQVLSRTGWTPARWRTIQPNLPPIFPFVMDGCSGPAGISVAIRPDATKNTRRAALTLQSVIESVLTQKPPFPVDSKLSSWGIELTKGEFSVDDIAIQFGPHPNAPGDPNAMRMQ
jgi:hypothetical protein